MLKEAVFAIIFILFSSFSKAYFSVESVGLVRGDKSLLERNLDRKTFM
jgi:hypothetical protein